MTDPHTRAKALAEQWWRAQDASPTPEAPESLIQAIESALLTYADEIRQEGRNRIHAMFKTRDADGKCQCPYCTGDVEALSDLAGHYEWDLYSAKEELEAEKASADVLTAERDRLRAALLLVRSTCRSTRDNCWCDDSRDIRALGHSTKCTNARAALSPEDR